MASHYGHLIQPLFPNTERGIPATAAFFLPQLPLGALDRTGPRGVD
ncbi:hypothetical protein [Hyphobacterium sp.]